MSWLFVYFLFCDLLFVCGLQVVLCFFLHSMDVACVPSVDFLCLIPPFFVPACTDTCSTLMCCTCPIIFLFVCLSPRAPFCLIVIPCDLGLLIIQWISLSWTDFLVVFNKLFVSTCLPAVWILGLKLHLEFSMLYWGDQQSHKGGWLFLEPENFRTKHDRLYHLLWQDSLKVIHFFFF